MAGEESPVLAVLKVFVRIFAELAVGYFGKVLGLIVPEAQGYFGFFVGRIALPCLMFNSMATIDFFSVQWSIIGACVLTKVVVSFIICIVGAFALPRSSMHPGGRLMFLGLLAILSVRPATLSCGHWQQTCGRE